MILGYSLNIKQVGIWGVVWMVVSGLQQLSDYKVALVIINVP